eukprot:m.364489 g.364489  ORF g.364489 m.364489 type:complete len:294 (-) comp56040_c0_seq1:89-970(-)
MGQPLSTASYPHADLLSALPLEISLKVISLLELRDVVQVRRTCRNWRQLVNHDGLWRFFCLHYFGHLRLDPELFTVCRSAQGLFKVLFHGSMLFSKNQTRGTEFLSHTRVVRDSPRSMAQFLFFNRVADPGVVCAFVTARPEILALFVELFDLKDLFFPDAMRRLFIALAPSQNRPLSSGALNQVSVLFIDRYCVCNPSAQPQREYLSMLFFSLLLLSADLHNPRVRTKMTKREFVRNIRGLTDKSFSDDYLGHVYDYVFLFGHLASPKRTAPDRKAEVLAQSSVNFNALQFR